MYFPYIAIDSIAYAYALELLRFAYLCDFQTFECVIFQYSLLVGVFRPTYTTAGDPVIQYTWAEDYTISSFVIRTDPYCSQANCTGDHGDGRGLASVRLLQF